MRGGRNLHPLWWGMTCHCLLTNERPVFGRTIIAQALGPVKISSQGWPQTTQMPLYFSMPKKNPLRGHQDAIFSGPFRHQNAFTSILIGLKISNAHPRSKSFPVTQVSYFPSGKKKSPTPRSKSSTKRTASKSPFQR